MLGIVRTDTVYVECKDSVVVKEANVSHQTSSISHLLKWICFIILGLIALIIILKVSSFRIQDSRI